VDAGFSAVTTAPIDDAAYQASTNSMLFGAHSASTSSWRTSRSNSPPATARTAAASSW